MVTRSHHGGPGVASAGIALIALLASGCALETPLPQAPSSVSTSSRSATPIPTATTSPTPTNDAVSQFDESAAYEDCTTNMRATFVTPGGDPSDVYFAALVDSQIVKRTDGLFYLYIEVENHTLDETQPELVSAAAAECVVGPGITPPEYALYMASIRSAPESRDPNMSIEQHD